MSGDVVVVRVGPCQCGGHAVPGPDDELIMTCQQCKKSVEITQHGEPPSLGEWYELFDLWHDTNAGEGEE